ncbi:KilA-N domain-containing protein [Neisseria lactamica]|uniref:KilA-N domain-containing protein n=1 Tax=Neisseria lactamica TaxID=486 RepID=UPI000BB5A448|nr:KilA-N domain-containing protein [Neisseria lactamica]
MMNAISISNVAIRQTENQLYSLNDLHKAAGNKAEHQPNRWLRNQQTQELIAEIEAEGGKAYTTSQGGKNRGTFVCKELVYAYATWISAKFFLLVIRTFDRVANGYQITPKPTRALPDGLTGEQIEAVKKLHNALTKSAPKEAQARIAITLWSAVKSKFGCSYKEVPAEQFPEVLSVMSRVAVENGVLYGEVLDREPLPAPQPALPISSNALYDLAVAVRYGAYAIQMGKDVSAPLRQLGCKQAVTMWTVWAETRSRLKAAANALEALNAHADAEHAAKIRPMLPEIRNLSSV